MLLAVLSLTGSVISIYALLQNTNGKKEKRTFLEIPVDMIVLYSGNRSSLNSAKFQVIGIAYGASNGYDTGTLQILTDGAHNHGGSTGYSSAGPGTYAVTPRSGYSVAPYGSHLHSISTDTTEIAIVSDRNHTLILN